MCLDHNGKCYKPGWWSFFALIFLTLTLSRFAKYCYLGYTKATGYTTLHFRVPRTRSFHP